MNKFDLFLWMIFLHFLFDFYIQTKSNGLIKSKEWWKNRHKQSGKRKYNYIMGLLMHSFVWSFAILLPFYYSQQRIYYGVLMMNIIVHAFTDNAKTNKKTISSFQDQLLHMIQIFVTWCILIWR